MRTPGPDMFLLGDQRRRPANGAAGITIALTRMLKRLVAPRGCGRARAIVFRVASRDPRRHLGAPVFSFDSIRPLSPRRCMPPAFQNKNRHDRRHAWMRSPIRMRVQVTPVAVCWKCDSARARRLGPAGGAGMLVERGEGT
jgi:hypothetical protein